MSCLRAVLALASIALLAGCASPAPDNGDAERPVAEFVDPSVPYAIDVYDPLERSNRAVYLFNAHFDRAIFLPLVDAYRAITPDFAQTAVTNFFSNVYEPRTVLNALLQGRFKRAVETAGRMMVNTTLGIFGLIDIATPMGLVRHEEDFGQTLGHWGVDAGPYLVLPLLGPSSLRDTVGLAGDAVAFGEIDLLNLSDNSTRAIAFYTMFAIDARHQVAFRYYESGSPFEYELIRLLYSKKRQLEIAR